MASYCALRDGDFEFPLICTSEPTKDQVYFGLPVKALIGRKFYEHDGSCGGQMITVGPEYLDWFEGVLDAGLSGADERERKDFTKMVDVLRDGGSVDMWFEV